MEAERDKLDLFELVTAVLLGLAATATALVSHEGALWGGKSVEAYSEAATMTSKASNLDNAAVVEASQDSNIEIEVKKLIREANRSKNEDDKEASLNLASYMLTELLSDAAYKAYALPMEYRDGAKTDEDLPEAALTKFQETEGLDKEYTETLYAESDALFDKADAVFQQGRDANQIGDSFSFAAVLYAISLFFAGIGMVLKSRVKWMVLIAGTLVFLGGTAFVSTVQWQPLL